MGRPRTEQALPQANSPFATSQSTTDHQEGQGIIVYAFYLQSPTVAAATRVVRRGEPEKEESTNGEYEVDITKYFKLVSTDVDETIFEDE